MELWSGNAAFGAVQSSQGGTMAVGRLSGCIIGLAFWLAWYAGVCTVSWAEEPKSESSAQVEHSSKGDHAHHDPYDLTHANASPKLTDVTELRFDHMLGSWLVFLLLFGVGGKLAWKPIVRGLEKREQAIAAKIEEAERSARAAEERLKQYEEKLAQAAEEARQLIARAQQEAERRGAEILSAAEQASRRERARALAEIDAARLAALEQLAQRSAELAVTMAARILQRQLSDEEHRRLLHQAIEQLGRHQ